MVLLNENDELFPHFATQVPCLGRIRGGAEDTDLHGALGSVGHL
jgi:hypothetical protein